jgi:hypothetical protein
MPPNFCYFYLLKIYYQLQVVNNFNNFFINVAKDIGNDNNLSAEEHPSIKIIKENKKEIPKLIFHEIGRFWSANTSFIVFLILLLNFFAFDMPPNFCYFYLL